MARKVELVARTQLKVDGIVGFMERKVVRYGTGAAVICPKEFLGRKAYLVVTRDMWEEGDAPEVGRSGRAREL